MKQLSILMGVLVIVFIVSYIATHAVISYVMAGLVVEPNATYQVLEVKPVPKNAVQTDQYTPIQPSVNPIGKEL